MTVNSPDRAKVAFWNETLAPFFGADTRRSVTQLLTTAFPFFGLWLAAYWALGVGYWLTLLLALGATGFLMRLFMIQHDCGHGSFFRSRRARNVVGFLIGVLTLTPYEYWRNHEVHAEAPGVGPDARRDATVP